MTYTLLIWQTIPENSDFYLIPNEVADKYKHFLKEAHNLFINSDDMNDGMRFLNSALGEDVPEEGFEDSLGIFCQYKVDIKAPILDSHITTVYLSGFVL